MTARIALIAFGSFLAYLVYSANSGSFPEVLLFYKNIPYGDTVGHFCLMGTFAFLAVWATRARSICIAGIRMPIGAAVVLIIVFLEEFSQLLISRRSFSLTDLAADVLGISILGWIATLLFRIPYREAAAPRNHY
jgi:polysaccharide biosynthesis protein VpsQ